MIHYLVNGSSDNWFYMRFASRSLADTYINMCLDADLGTAYPDGGWQTAKPENTNVVDNNTTLITDTMLKQLQQNLSTTTKDKTYVITDFEIEHGWDDENDDAGAPY